MELLDGVGDDAEQFNPPCPNLAMEDTYGAVERTMSAVGVRTASERLRQRSASSPASSRASGGARVRARVEEGDNDRGKCEFIGSRAALCYYTGAPGGSHLRNAWPVCGGLFHVPRTPGLSGGRSYFSGFHVEE